MSDNYAPNWMPYFSPEGNIIPGIPFEVDCPICEDRLAVTEPPDKGMELLSVLPCGHAFGHKCVSEWVDHAEEPTCPTCRFSLLYSRCEHAFVPQSIQFNHPNLRGAISDSISGALPPLCPHCEAHGMTRSSRHRERGPQIIVTGSGDAPPPQIFVQSGGSRYQYQGHQQGHSHHHQGQHSQASPSPSSSRHHHQGSGSRPSSQAASSVSSSRSHHHQSHHSHASGSSPSSSRHQGHSHHQQGHNHDHQGHNRHHHARDSRSLSPSSQRSPEVTHYHHNPARVHQVVAEVLMQSGHLSGRMRRMDLDDPRPRQGE